ncbi:hypothetical protein KUTeg_001611 [Tegillarca granosa]|uniref:Uncharacterized protein n=1 Tax=Tegillarca granosa TaxID=220873 RepID=A0ABQ9FRX9_TEGGR|nr:hypothetical protein KUTeg_001611 [Tegillarca granosa]
MLSEDNYKKCDKCNRDMNVIDDHAECFRHRVCTEEFSCEICKNWTPSRWSSYRKMVDKVLSKTGLVPSSEMEVTHRPTTSTLSQVSSRGNTLSNQQPASLRSSTVPVMSQSVRQNFASADQNFSDQLFSEFIDNRIRKYFESLPSRSDSRVRSRMTELNEQDEDSSSRFNRFLNESSKASDILDVTLTDSDNNQFREDHESVSEEEDSDITSRASSTENMVEWKSFIHKMAQELGISLENEKANNEFASYISDRLKSSKEVVKLRLPMDGSTIQALLDVDKEWQTKAKIRAFKARDDSKYAVMSDHFDKFCKTPKLDDNIEEGITQINNTRGTSKVVNSTVHRGKFKFKNKDDVPRNAELKKIDLSARLLLREISYGSLITSYLDKVVSDEDKTEALQALVELFNYGRYNV